MNEQSGSTQSTSKTNNNQSCKPWNMNCCGPASTSAGAVYGLGLLGALYFYLTTATSLTAGIIGVIKAILWPAVLVYGSLKMLGI